MLKVVAPNSLSTIEALPRTRAIRDEFPQIEQRFMGDPSILQRLSAAYLQEGDSASAERCARRWIELSPCYDAWQGLAKVKEVQGDDAGWLDASRHSLEHPVRGLEHARTQSDIADYFLNLEQLKEAVPYADAAADSGAAWAMLQAAKVHEELGNMKEAERYQRDTAERYSDATLDWFMWCLRTGAGNLDEALAHAQQSIDAWGNELPDDYHAGCDRRDD
jgi:tetratricopeptide (TPR) repeat protein